MEYWPQTPLGATDYLVFWLYYLFNNLKNSEFHTHLVPGVSDKRL